MRLSLSFLKNRTRLLEIEPKVPFNQRLPLTLRDRVTSKNASFKEKGCLYEMSLLLNCLKENNFQNNLCEAQIGQFNKCYDVYLRSNHIHKQQRKKSLPTPGATNFSDRQMTAFLRMYPHV